MKLGVWKCQPCLYSSFPIDVAGVGTNTSLRESIVSVFAECAPLVLHTIVLRTLVLLAIRAYRTQMTVSVQYPQKHPIRRESQACLRARLFWGCSFQIPSPNDQSLLVQENDIIFYNISENARSRRYCKRLYPCPWWARSPFCGAMNFFLH